MARTSLLLFLDTRSQVVSGVYGRDGLVKHLEVASFVFVFETAVPNAAFIGSPCSAR